MWNELEKFMRAHGSTSDAHKVVLDCLCEIKRPSESASPKKAAAEKSQTRDEEVEQSWKELDR